MGSALKLYVWNAGLSGALFGPLHAVEVGLRNAIHGQMSTIFGTSSWYSTWPFKRGATPLVGDFAEALGRLVREGKPVDPPHVMAALHFGFWTQLLKPGPDGNYTRLFWNAGLCDAFAYYPGGARKNQGDI